MSRKHYNFLAKALLETMPKYGTDGWTIWSNVRMAIALELKCDNSSFNMDRFYKATEPKE